MIGLLIVTHGQLAQQLIAAVEHIVSRQEKLRAIAIGADDDMEERRQHIAHSLAELDSGAGVIILTDMFGGTPSNLALSMMGRGKVEVVAGVNLPMLVRLAQVRAGHSLAEAAKAAAEAGRKYITIASQFLEQEKEQEKEQQKKRGKK